MMMKMVTKNIISLLYDTKGNLNVKIEEAIK